jgi:hypothetical protein
MMNIKLRYIFFNSKQINVYLHCKIFLSDSSYSIAVNYHNKGAFQKLEVDTVHLLTYSWLLIESVVCQVGNLHMLVYCVICLQNLWNLDVHCA